MRIRRPTVVEEPTCRLRGRVVALDHRTTDPADLPGFDVVVDAVGTSLPAYRRLARRTVTITAFGQPSALLATAASTIHGSRRIRTFGGKLLAPGPAALAAHVESGEVQPVVAGIHRLDQAAEAHRRAEAGGNLGKQIIRVA